MYSTRRFRSVTRNCPAADMETSPVIHAVSDHHCGRCVCSCERNGLAAAPCTSAAPYLRSAIRWVIGVHSCKARTHLSSEARAYVPAFLAVMSRPQQLFSAQCTIQDTWGVCGPAACIRTIWLAACRVAMSQPSQNEWFSSVHQVPCR